MIEPLADDISVEPRRRQDRRQPPGGLDAVDLAADPAARPRAAAGDVRFASLGLRPRGFLCRAAVASHRRRRRGAGQQAHGAAARSRALLYRPRHVSRGEGRARRGAGRRPAGRGRHFRDGAARGRRDHDEPARRTRSRISPIRRSATSTTRRCGGRSPMRGRANGRRRARASRPWKRRWRRCRSNCSGSRSRTKCAPRSRSAISPAPPTSSTISRPSACRTSMEPAIAVLMGRLAEGTRPQRGRARGLSHRGEFVGSAGGGARPAARDRAALLSSAISSATTSSIGSGIADHDLARRRDRDRGAASAGPPLHRGRPLSRRVLCHAQRHGGASGFGP